MDVEQEQGLGAETSEMSSGATGGEPTQTQETGGGETQQTQTQQGQGRLFGSLEEAEKAVQELYQTNQKMKAKLDQFAPLEEQIMAERQAQEAQVRANDFHSRRMMIAMEADALDKAGRHNEAYQKRLQPILETVVPIVEQLVEQRLQNQIIKPLSSRAELQRNERMKHLVEAGATDFMLDLEARGLDRRYIGPNVDAIYKAGLAAGLKQAGKGQHMETPDSVDWGDGMDEKTFTQDARSYMQRMLKGQ